MVKTIKKKKVADIELISKLIEQSGVTIFRIETDLKMSRSLLLRGLNPESKIKLPPKWELPIIKYLKKKIAEKQDVELQTEETKLELGLHVEEKPCDLKEDLKEVKRDWVGMLGDD